MSVRAIKVVPTTLDYKSTLKRFEGYYCEDKIHKRKVLLTQAEDYGTNHTKAWQKKQRLARIS